jgi:hypothetical protein
MAPPPLCVIEYPMLQNSALLRLDEVLAAVLWLNMHPLASKIPVMPTSTNAALPYHESQDGTTPA